MPGLHNNIDNAEADSESRTRKPSDYKSDALPIELYQQKWNLWQFYIHLTMRMGLVLYRLVGDMSDLQHNHLELHQNPVAPTLYQRAGIEPALMEDTRFELVTPCLQGKCSPNWAIAP